MKILVTGGSGYLGTYVRQFFSADDFSRRSNLDVRDEQAAEKAADYDAVIHLAGENIAQRWTKEAKQRIRDSRVEGTRLLVEGMSRLPKPPRVVLCASATGIYGDRGFL